MKTKTTFIGFPNSKKNKKNLFVINIYDFSMKIKSFQKILKFDKKYFNNIFTILKIELAFLRRIYTLKIKKYIQNIRKIMNILNFR